MTPPATTTAIAALTAQSPTVWDLTLRPVTIAHIIALEKAGCQLVLGFTPPTTMDALLALVVLSKDGAGALSSAKDVPALTRTAEALAIHHAPHEVAAMSRAVGEWLAAAYDTHVAAANDTDPLASRPDEAASAGLSNSLNLSPLNTK